MHSYIPDILLCALVKFSTANLLLYLARMIPSSLRHTRLVKLLGESGSMLAEQVKLKDVCSNLITCDWTLTVG